MKGEDALSHYDGGASRKMVEKHKVRSKVLAVGGENLVGPRVCCATYSPTHLLEPLKSTEYE